MRSKRRKSYIIGSGYIGAGNKFSVIAARPRSAYQHIRSVYGAELQRWEDSGRQGLSGKELSAEDRILLKNKIRKRLQQERKIRRKQLVLTTLITPALIIGGYFLIKWLVSGLF